MYVPRKEGPFFDCWLIFAKMFTGVMYSFTEGLNWCIVILARPPVSLFSAYALANSQIEFRFGINN
jgi:hypothetical protein